MQNFLWLSSNFSSIHPCKTYRFRLYIRSLNPIYAINLPSGGAGGYPKRPNSWEWLAAPVAKATESFEPRKVSTAKRLLERYIKRHFINEPCQYVKENPVPTMAGALTYYAANVAFFTGKNYIPLTSLNNLIHHQRNDFYKLLGKLQTKPKNAHQAQILLEHVGLLAQKQQEILKGYNDFCNPFLGTRLQEFCFCIPIKRSVDNPYLSSPPWLSKEILDSIQEGCRRYVNLADYGFPEASEILLHKKTSIPNPITSLIGVLAANEIFRGRRQALFAFLEQPNQVGVHDWSSPVTMKKLTRLNNLLSLRNRIPAGIFEIVSTIFSLYIGLILCLSFLSFLWDVLKCLLSKQQKLGLRNMTEKLHVILRWFTNPTLYCLVYIALFLRALLFIPLEIMQNLAVNFLNYSKQLKKNK